MKNIINTPRKIAFEAEYTIRSAVFEDIALLKWSLPDWNSYWQDKWQQKMEGKLDMYVVIINNFPIGYVWLNWTKYAENEIGEIASFVIMDPFQSKGIGTNVMSEMENILREKGIKIAQTGTYKSNERAKKLYERLGYKTIGDKQNSFEYTTESGEVKTYSADCWVMHKSLE